MTKLLKSPTLWIIIIVLALGYVLATWVNSIGGPEVLQQRYGLLAPVITGSILFVLTPSPFPSDVISVAHGALYGFVFASVLNWLCLWAAAFLEAGLGRRLGADLNVEEELKKLPKFMQKLPVGHPAFLILGRQVPMVGSNITTLLPSVLGVPMRRIVVCSAIGILPSACALAAAGAGLLQL